MTRTSWDVVIVGGGPAGASAAIGALHADPSASVLVLDRSDFPRDKCCGDAVLEGALAELAAHGVPQCRLVDGYAPSDVLTLQSAAGRSVTRTLPHSMLILPREVFDARLLAAACALGAVFRRHTVRQVHDRGSHVEIDDIANARVCIGADGVESAVRRAVGGDGRRDIAVAIRGYDSSTADPTSRIVLDHHSGMAYAWRFPTTSGPANVGYGHLLRSGESANRRSLLSTMHALLPGLDVDPHTLRAHRLPLSSSRQVAARGRIVLAGDAASLVNPVSGEGISYAISSGLAAGTAAVLEPNRVAAQYRTALRRRFARHHRHVTLLAGLTGWRAVVDAALSAAAGSQRVFDDIAELSLAEGLITPRLAANLALSLGHRGIARGTGEG